MSETDDRRADYDAYLKSAAWKAKRAEFKASDLFHDRCEACKEPWQSGWHIHHKTYIRFKNEALTDLVALCEKCHDMIHDLHKSSGNKLTLWKVTEKYTGIPVKSDPSPNSQFKKQPQKTKNTNKCKTCNGLCKKNSKTGLCGKCMRHANPGGKEAQKMHERHVKMQAKIKAKKENESGSQFVPRKPPQRKPGDPWGIEIKRKGEIT